MKVVGIIGGVGAGKSTVLSILSDLTDCTIIIADELAKTLMQYGNVLCDDAIRLFGEQAYDEKGRLNRRYIASRIYADKELLNEWNGLVHPAVNKAIYAMIDKARCSGPDYFFIESALLIENGYDAICDEMWYVYCPENIRIARLIESRGYTEEKCRSIMANQLSDDEFRRYADFIIDTSKSIDDTCLIIKNYLEQ